MKKTYFVDCFDTVIFRNKKNSDIFQNWADRLGKECAIDGGRIYKLYNSLNVGLCIKKILTRGVLEEHFEVILEHLYKKLKNRIKLEQTAFINLAKRLYLEEEAASHYVKPGIISYLHQLKQQGNELYMVSDFYCSKDMLEAWLTKLGLGGLFTYVFVSCDFDKEKAGGKLYRHILRTLGLSAKNVTMIGDNAWSDLFVSRLNGLAALNVKKLMNKKIINEEWDSIFNKYGDNYNFSNHAFPLFLFTKRLYEALEKNNNRDIIFMSREGQFLKTLFEKYCLIRKEAGLGVIDIKTHYFYGSRNSVMAASLEPLESEDFDLLFRFFVMMSANAFLHSIGFTKQQIEEVGKDCSFNMKKTHLVFNKSGAYKKLRQNKTFCRIYEENRKEQSQAFGKYMESFGIDYKKNGFVFVDIGYHGTMQDLINKFYDYKVSIKGYFVKTRTGKKEMNEKIGLISDKANKALYGNKINSYDAYNYEQILRADHGRCLGYKMEGDKAVPVIDTHLDDKEVYENYVKQMQAQILDKFEMIAHKAITENQMENIEKICVVYYYCTIKYKSLQDYKWIIDMQDTSHDDFGIVGTFGKFFAQKLRKDLFTIKDKNFVFKNRGILRLTIFK